jgi:peptide deformylase
LELENVQIIKYPHPTLRHKSKPLRRVDRELAKLIANMFDLMYEQRGIGLAANQVDLPYRLFILNLEGDPSEKECELVFINPVISERKGMVEREEGCLSFPEIWAPVRRPEKVKITAYNLAGQEVTYQAEGMLARAAQHELDHLDGVLFIDHLAPTNRLEVKEPLSDLEQEFEGNRSRGLIPADPLVAARLAELEQLRT